MKVEWTSYKARCKGDWRGQTIYKSGWKWKGGADRCSPYSWTTRNVSGAGVGNLYKNGVKKAVILCSIQANAKGSYLYVRKYCKKY